MTVVVGTAGHIDHGKTSLLRALTGIDADRLPEERRRGMTIDVGYAHFRLPDGTELDFVDVPGHDRLIGNMLVGAGEIDAAMLVVAADDGPRAQTLEHLELLDALGISAGLAVVTKTDLVDESRLAMVVDEVHALLAGTGLAGAPVLPASSVTRAGLDAVRAALAALAGHIAGRTVSSGPPRLAIDRVFTVRGRGTVATGSLRGGSLGRGDIVRAEPGGGQARVRELQVHNDAVDRIAGGGRVALNLVGLDEATLRRGVVLTSGPGIEVSERPLVELRARRPAGLRHGATVRVHIGTEQVDATLDLGRRAAAGLPDGRTTAILRLERPIAAAFGDSFVLRQPSPGATLAGGRVLHPLPPRGISRRRLAPATLGRLAEADLLAPEGLAALVALHGVLPAARHAAWAALAGEPVASAGVLSEPSIEEALLAAAAEGVPTEGMPIADLRAVLLGKLRRQATVDRATALAIADRAVGAGVDSGAIVRDGERLLPRGSRAGPSAEVAASMVRLAAVLAVPAPPSLADAARAARCPPEGLRALEAAGRIVRVEDDLAWETATYRRLEALAVQLARAGPLSPASYRDATGTSRRFALSILEDLGRRGLLQRTPQGHVPGPRAGAIGATA